MSADYGTVLGRYVGRHVCISTYAQVKVWGKVAGVYEDCVRLVETLLMGELEDQGWFSQIQFADPEQAQGPRHPETVVHFHHISAITCADDDVVDVPVPEADDADWPQVEAPHADEAAEDDATPPGWLQVNRLEVRIGEGLLGLVHPDRGVGLSERIARLRNALAASLGIKLPTIRIRDEMPLPPEEYRVLIDGCEVGRSTLYPGALLAIDPGSASAGLEGRPTSDPTFGLAATWIDPRYRFRAEKAGYTVVEPAAVLVTHLYELVKRHAHELLTYEDVAKLLAQARTISPTVVDDVVPRWISVGVLHHILCRLLEEGVPIKNLVRILESLARRSTLGSDVDALVAAVRLDLGRAICEPFRDDEGRVIVFTLDRRIQKRLAELLEGGRVLVGEKCVAAMAARLRRLQQQCEAEGLSAALVVDAGLRVRLWRALSPLIPQVAVLARNEIPRDLPMEVRATLRPRDAGLDDGPEPSEPPAATPSTSGEPGSESQPGVADGTYRPKPAPRPR